MKPVHSIFGISLLFLPLSAFAIYGDKISITDAPWSVSLRSEETFHGCGGTLIAPRWIITAGDCTEWMDSKEPPATQLSVWAGNSDIEKLVSLPAIKAVYYPPGFSFTEEPIKLFKLTIGIKQKAKNNLALIELVSEASLPAPGKSKKAKRRAKAFALTPMPLHESSLEKGDSLFLAGWGDTAAGERTIKQGSSRDLRGFKATYLPTPDAILEMERHHVDRSYVRLYVSPPEIMTILSTQTICSGDSGSGIVRIAEDGGKTLVAASTHANDACASSSEVRASSGTRIEPFLSWIHATMEKNQ